MLLLSIMLSCNLYFIRGIKKRERLRIPINAIKMRLSRLLNKSTHERVKKKRIETASSRE